MKKMNKMKFSTSRVMRITKIPSLNDNPEQSKILGKEKKANNDVKYQFKETIAKSKYEKLLQFDEAFLSIARDLKYI